MVRCAVSYMLCKATRCFARGTKRVLWLFVSGSGEGVGARGRHSICSWQLSIDVFVNGGLVLKYDVENGGDHNVIFGRSLRSFTVES